MRQQDFYCGRCHNKGLLFYLAPLLHLPQESATEREERVMSNEMMRREVMEAIQAGERALESLKRAGNELNSARNWGIVDMFGGGLVTDIFKHSKMNRAVQYMEEARRDLRIFQRELKDVHVPMEFRMEVGSFLSFADFFFDGIVADYLVQSKIAEARAQVEDAQSRVQYLLTDLGELV